MVISTITSGLGNQLFQYALARQISANKNSSLYFDLRFYASNYSRETNRSFKLDKFNINYTETNTPIELLMKAVKIFHNKHLFPFYSTIQEQYYHFNPETLNPSNYIVNIKGYWHSERYFEGIAPVIRKELIFRNVAGSAFEDYRRLIESSENAVSIHIRRGDYVHHPEFSKTFGFIGLAYYKRAISLMEDMVSNCKFFIFTDDKEWVLGNFDQNENLVFVNNNGADADLDDLHLMKLCKHNIIANSSFSWWGAWLNDNDEKVVIAPLNWFKNQPNWDTKDLLPASWLKI